MNTYPFPPEIVSPKQKESKAYGLQHVKAQYYTNNRYGFRSIYDNIDYQSLIEFSQGRQSVTNIRKLFGYHRDGQRAAASDGPESLAYIDVQVLNLAPKYINRAVAKVMRNNFDISLEAIDLVSRDEKADFAATVQTLYRMKDWVQQMGIPLQAAFPGLDVSSLPKYPDELLYNLTVNPKIRQEIAGEMALKLVFSVNNFKQKFRETIWDIVVLGKGHLHTYHDRNMVPRVDRINPKYWYGSYIDNDDFEGQDYAGFVECITVNQFLNEAGGMYSQSQLEEIVSTWGVKNSAFQSYLYDRTLAEYDNLTYIPVVRFYFLSQDNQAWVTRPNKHDNDTIIDRPYGWLPDEKVAGRYAPGGDSKIYRGQYTSVYGGTWVIDSDIVYGYGRKPYPRTNMVDLTLPIKTFATNFKDGRAVSFASQIVEPIYMINVAWNKVKAILAKERIGVREIDFTALEEVAMGRNGEAWTPRDVYNFMEMTGTLIKRTNVNQYGQTNGSAINFVNTGVDLASYFNTINTSIQLLEQMTGSAITESSNVPDRLPAAAVEASTLSSDFDMEYLYNAHEYLYKKTAHQMLLLTQESKRQGTVLRGYADALNGMTSGYVDVDESMAYSDFGMMLGRQPGPAEWSEFYMDVREMLKAGFLGASDSAFLREIDNLKQARQMLAIREEQYRRRTAEEAQRNNQMMMEANAQSAELKMQADMALIEREGALKAELLKLEGAIKGQLQAQKSQQDFGTKQYTSQMDRQIERQKGVDEITKTAVRNQADFDKNNAHRQSAQLKAVTDLQKAKEQAKKPAAPAKKK